MLTDFKTINNLYLYIIKIHSVCVVCSSEGCAVTNSGV